MTLYEFGTALRRNINDLINTFKMFVVASFQDPNWYKAKNSAGREGTIPANYVQKREGVKSGGKLSLMP